MTEQLNVYVADLKISLMPRSPKSRLQPIIRTFYQWPVVMTSGMNVHNESLKNTIKRALKGRMSDIDKYVLKYELSNVKFSTKCSWTEKE